MSKRRYIVIPNPVSNSIHSARAECLPRETGGFLVGQRRGDHLEIVSCTHQGKGDIATQTSFSRLSRQHAETIDAAWQTSDGLQSIIGDWHSHPTGTALPSSTDKRAWKALTKTMKAPGIGLIAADDETRIFYFALQWGQLRISECPVEETSDNDSVYVVLG